MSFPNIRQTKKQARVYRIDNAADIQRRRDEQKAFIARVLAKEPKPKEKV